MNNAPSYGAQDVPASLQSPILQQSRTGLWVASAHYDYAGHERFLQSRPAISPEAARQDLLFLFRSNSECKGEARHD